MQTKERLKKGSPFSMQTVDLYLKLNKCAKVQVQDVFLSDIATVFCTDHTILAKARSLKIHSFQENGPHRQCISALVIIEALTELSPAVSVQNVGEMDILVEYDASGPANRFWEICKIIFVALVSFFGTAFTIMAFHNDIGIQKFFSGFYFQIMGEIPEGPTVLDISYSIGLALGITAFFNHVGKRRLTTDPTPIEVEMKMYEDDINTTLMETAKRNGESMEVKN